MYRETQDHQMSLNDRYLTAGSQTRSAVEKSRAWLVGQVIYPNVDESRFAALFSDDKAPALTFRSVSTSALSS